MSDDDENNTDKNKDHNENNEHNTQNNKNDDSNANNKNNTNKEKNKKVMNKTITKENNKGKMLNIVLDIVVIPIICCRCCILRIFGLFSYGKTSNYCFHSLMIFGLF